MMTTIISDKQGVEHKGQDSIVNSNNTHTDTPYRLFLVDDDPMVLKMLQFHFANFKQYEITTFSTGEACLDAMSRKPDVIVLDYNLSEYTHDDKLMDGLDILKRIKDKSPDTNVIMLSSQVEVHIAVDCLRNGAVNYIIKDGVMQLNVEKAINALVKSQELKEEINQLSTTIKRDKLLIRGYTIFTVFLAVVLFYLWNG
ncbi:MAG: response regulator [Saprospiraceae bacterium]